MGAIVVEGAGDKKTKEKKEEEEGGKMRNILVLLHLLHQLKWQKTRERERVRGSERRREIEPRGDSSVYKQHWIDMRDDCKRSRRAKDTPDSQD